MEGNDKHRDQSPRLSLGWQILLLIVCIRVGSRLTNAYGPKLADTLNIDFFFGRTMIEIFFAAVVAIVAVVIYRAARTVVRK